MGLFGYLTQPPLSDKRIILSRLRVNNMAETDLLTKFTSDFEKGWFSGTTWTGRDVTMTHSGCGNECGGRTQDRELLPGVAGARGQDTVRQDERYNVLLLRKRHMKCRKAS